MKPGLKIIVYSCMLVMSAACSNGGNKNISFEDASQLVVDEVIQPDMLENDLIAFAHPESLQPGDVLQPYNFFGENPAPGQTSIDADAWFFWLDDAPGAKFAHENRYVFVDRQTGEVTVLEQEWWPVLNGQGLWLDDMSYYDPDNWIYSTVSLTEDEASASGGSSGLMSQRMPGTPLLQSSEGSVHALVINASNADERGADAFIDDGRNVIQKFKDAGFETTYMGPPSDPHPDRVSSPFGETSRQSDQPWRKWLEEHAGTIQPGDTLFVYVTGHGSYAEGSSYIGGKNGIVSDRKPFADVLRKYNPGVDIIVIADSCYSGGYADALEDIADVTLTASNTTWATYGDIDFVLSWVNPLFLTDLNPNDEGSEFTSSLLEGWISLLAEPEEVDRIKREADERGLGFWPFFTAEAYEDGEIYNWPARMNISYPITRFGSEKTRKVVQVQGETDDIKFCSTGELVGKSAPAHQDADYVWASWETVNGENVLRFNARFPGVDTIQPAIWGGFEIYNPSRPVSEDHEGYIFNSIGNFQLGFLAGEAMFTPRLNEVDDDGHWQNIPKPPFSGFVHDNIISVDVPGVLVPPDGNFYFYTDDGSYCDSVGLDSNNQPTGVIPYGGPSLIFTPPNFNEPASVLPLTMYDLPGGAQACDTGEAIDDPGVDIRQVDFTFPSEDSLNVDVYLGDPGPAKLDNFSLAVTLDLFYDVNYSQIYTVEFHAGEWVRSRLDPTTGALIDSDTGFNMKESTLNDLPVTKVAFEIPLADLPAQVDGINVFSFRTFEEGDPKHCDYMLGLFQPPFVIGGSTE